MEWGKFLAQIPPNETVDIEELFKNDGSNVRITDKDVQLYCDSDECKGIRYFHLKYGPYDNISYGSKDTFLSYWCRNCQHMGKTFSVKLIQPEKASLNGKAMKYGESPPFGPFTPSKVITLIGPDRDLFLRGRRAENQGLGIGAFAYYRRVIENQKARLITEISKVAKRLGASQDLLDRFDKAAKEIQFNKAIKDIKDVMPATLLIDGHNPLALLHSALSEGIHEETEEKCLEMATSIRLVLTELAERISIALRDEAELKQAISNLMNKNKTDKTQST